MACFEAELKKRYVVFPPSSANSIGFTTKLKGALGKAKIKQILTPRFKVVGSLIEKLPALIENDPAFAREIHEAGEKANMLKGDSASKLISEGLKKIRDEGWLQTGSLKLSAENLSNACFPISETF